MGKRGYSKEEVEILRSKREVKYADERSIRFRLEFRQELYDETKPEFKREEIRKKIRERIPEVRIKEENIWMLVRNFRRARPKGGGNEEIYKYTQKINEEKEYDKYLLETGKFKTRGRGIKATKELIEEIKNREEGKTVEEYLESIGIDVSKIGYYRLRRIKESVSGEEKRENKELSDEQYKYLKNHPYVQKITPKRVTLRRCFYKDASQFKDLPIDKILSIFEIGPECFSKVNKINVYYKIKNYQIGGNEETPGQNIELLIKILKNRCEQLESMVNAGFKAINMTVKQGFENVRKEVCQFVKDVAGIDEYGYTVRELLKKVGISKSSYYSILKNENYGIYREKKEQEDIRDIGKIRDVISFNKYPKGNRVIFMLLKRKGESMSRNKIYRLCRKFDVKCGVRKHKGSRQAAMLLLKRNMKENLLKRKFKLGMPGEVILTDVSYLKCKFGTFYLSAIKDPSCGKVKLNVSTTNNLDLVLESLKGLPKNDGKVTKILHSDQGVLYLNDTFQERVKSLGYTQSMSKRGNCWDNSPQESFFGHMKDEVNFKDCETFAELEKEIAEYEQYYNTQRPQWGLRGMTPVEFEQYLLSMSEEERERYLQREQEKYEIMMDKAKANAIKRSKVLKTTILP